MYIKEKKPSTFFHAQFQQTHLCRCNRKGLTCLRENSCFSCSAVVMKQALGRTRSWWYVAKRSRIFCRRIRVHYAASPTRCSDSCADHLDMLGLAHDWIERFAAHVCRACLFFFFFRPRAGFEKKHLWVKGVCHRFAIHVS